MEATPAVQARRWRAGVATSVSGLLLVGFDTIRLGVVDHDWPFAIALDIAVVAAIPLVGIWQRRRDAARLATAPAGTLYVGGVSFRSHQFTTQPSLTRFLSGAKFRHIGGGWISGTLIVNATGVVVEPGGFWGRGLLPVSIEWSQTRSIELAKVPGKVNVGALDLRLSDGSTLRLQPRGYNRLRAALAKVDRA